MGPCLLARSHCIWPTNGWGPGKLLSDLGILVSISLIMMAIALHPLKNIAVAIFIQWGTDQIMVVNGYLPTYQKNVTIWADLEQCLQGLIMDNTAIKVIVVRDLNPMSGPSDQFLYDNYKDSVTIAGDHPYTHHLCCSKDTKAISCWNG